MDESILEVTCEKSQVGSSTTTSDQLHLNTNNHFVMDGFSGDTTIQDVYFPVSSSAPNTSVFDYTIANQSCQLDYGGREGNTLLLESVFERRDRLMDPPSFIPPIDPNPNSSDSPSFILDPNPNSTTSITSLLFDAFSTANNDIPHSLVFNREEDPALWTCLTFFCIQMIEEDGRVVSFVEYYFNHCHMTFPWFSQDWVLDHLGKLLFLHKTLLIFLIVYR